MQGLPTQSLLLCVKVKFTVYVSVLGGCSAPGIYSGTQVDATRHFNPFLSGSPWEWIPYQTSGSKELGEGNGGTKPLKHSTKPESRTEHITRREPNYTTTPEGWECSLAKDPGRREAAHDLCCRKVKKFGLKGGWRDCAVWHLDIGDLPLQEYLAEPWRWKWSGQI